MCVGVQPRQEIKDDPASGRDLSRGTCARTEQPCDPPTLYGPLAREGAKVDDRNAQTRSLPARTDRWRSHIDCLIECRQRSSETRGVLYTLGVSGSCGTVTLAPCRQKLVVRLGRQQYRRPNLLIGGGVVMAERTPKKVVVSAAAAKKAGARATKASAKLEAG